MAGGGNHLFKNTYLIVSHYLVCESLGVMRGLSLVFCELITTPAPKILLAVSRVYLSGCLRGRQNRHVDHG